VIGWSDVNYGEPAKQTNHWLRPGVEWMGALGETGLLLRNAYPKEDSK